MREHRCRRRYWRDLFAQYPTARPQLPARRFDQLLEMRRKAEPELVADFPAWVKFHIDEIGRSGNGILGEIQPGERHQDGCEDALPSLKGYIERDEPGCGGCIVKLEAAFPQMQARAALEHLEGLRSSYEHRPFARLLICMFGITLKRRIANGNGDIEEKGQLDLFR